MTKKAAKNTETKQTKDEKQTDLEDAIVEASKGTGEIPQGEASVEGGTPEVELKQASDAPEDAPEDTVYSDIEEFWEAEINNIPGRHFYNTGIKHIEETKMKYEEYKRSLLS